MGMSERDDIIAEMREYFEQRADAEYFTDSAGPVPNEEMRMLAKLDELQAARETAGLSRGELDTPMTDKFKAAWKNGLPLESMEAKWAFVGWQAAREQEGVEVVYQLKSKFGGGWDDVSEDEYSCAHESYVRRALYTHPSQSQGVPEGYMLAPKSMCITQEDVGFIAMMTGWDDEDQDDAEGVLWFGLIEDDEGNRTHGLNISCYECMEEGAIQLVQFDEPISTAAAPQAVEIEPDLFWDYDNGEDSGQDSAYELADYCASDLPHGETMEVVVMCAKRLPNRHMKIWVDDDDDVQWEWISPKPPEQEDAP
jgi:hypothetical protein